jgi:hypothetical protein
LSEGWIELAKHAVTHGPQRVVGVLPLLRGPEVAITAIPAGEPYVVDRQPELALGLQCRPKRAFHLVRDLVRATEHVGVVEGDLADSAQTPDNTPDRSALNIGASSFSRIGSSR